MRGVAIVLAIGLLATTAIVVSVLGQHPLSVIEANSVAAGQELGSLRHGPARVCQARERVPAGTSAIRVSLSAFTGPRVQITASAGGRVFATGERASAWTGDNVTVPVRRVPSTVSSATICFLTGPIGERISVYGSPTPPATAARSIRDTPLEGRFRTEYLRPGSSSWLALASPVATHMGLGRAWSGSWVAVWALALLLAMVALVSRVILRELDE